jgi:1-acyl-sn-glycerol-3-phosphate acyltransferase
MLDSIWRLAVGFTVVAVASTVAILAALVLLPSRVARIKLCNYYGKVVGYAVARIAGARPVVHHPERLAAAYPAIYVANHTSTLDAFLSIWLCPVGGCGVMKKEVLRIPFFGQLYVLSGHPWLDRSRHDKAVASLNEVGALVKKHRLAIWIMPEGTRSRSGRIATFKPGFVHLAIATGLPVVPVAFMGAHRCWPAGTFEFHPTRVDVDVLEPVDTAGWRAETAQHHADEVRDVLARALPEEQR